MEDTYLQQNIQFRKIIFGLLGLIVLGGICGFLFRDTIQDIGQQIVDRFGLWGLSLGVIITDTSPLPLTSEPIALIGLGANIPTLQIALIMSATSHLCGPLGYGLGRLVGKTPGLRKHFKRKLPNVCHFMEKHGVKGVAIAALTPIPFALSSWTAGMMQVSFWGVCMASSLRWVKTTIAVLLLAGGWQLGS